MKINIAPIAHDKGASLAIDVAEELSLLPPDKAGPVPECSFAGTSQGDTVQLMGPVRFRGDITNAGKLFYLRGQVDAHFATQCARCLEPVGLDVTVPIQAEFKRLSSEASSPRTGRAEGADHFSTAAQRWDDAEITVFQGDVVDFTEVVRGELNLAIPYRVLCREDCKGLCPRCGANLNEGACGCVAEEGDLRLAALAEWKLGEKGPNGQKS